MQGAQQPADAKLYLAAARCLGTLAAVQGATASKFFAWLSARQRSNMRLEDTLPVLFALSVVSGTVWPWLWGYRHLRGVTE